MTNQYPFHPATGQRLVRVLETAIYQSAARIVKVDGAAVIDDIQAQISEPGNRERAQIDGIPFVATIAGHTCLLSEATWSPLEVEQLEGFTAGSTGTDLPSLNAAMCDLIHLGEASQSVVDNWETRDLSTAVCNLESAVQTCALLSSQLSDEPMDLQG